MHVALSSSLVLPCSAELLCYACTFDVFTGCYTVTRVRSTLSSTAVCCCTLHHSLILSPPLPSLPPSLPPISPWVSCRLCCCRCGWVFGLLCLGCAGACPNSRPHWGETFKFALLSLERSLVVQVWDADELGADVLLGEVRCIIRTHEEHSCVRDVRGARELVISLLTRVGGVKYVRGVRTHPRELNFAKTRIFAG